MTPFTEEQHLVFRLARCGWTYMPSLEFIRAHRGDAEAQVRRVEAEHAAQFVPTDLATRVALAEEQMYDELARLVKPEAIARLRAAEDQMLREIIGGPDA